MDSKEIDLISTVIFLILIVIIIMSILIIILLIYNKKEKEKLEYEIELINVNSQKNLLKTQLEIQEQTFQQISREIHDHIGQRLTLARLYINQLATNISEKKLDAMNESSSLIEEAIGDLKQLSRSLTANLIKDEGLLHALEFEITRVSRVISIEINLNHEGDLPFMPLDNEIVIYRILQESLQNVIRHAEATRVDIHLKHSTEALTLIIEDNGKGFNPELIANRKQGTNSGLSNMKTRAELLQGMMHIVSKEGSGTTLQFTFPNQNLTSTYAQH